MDVAQLRRALDGLPGDLPVVFEDSRAGWMQNTTLYLVPAHIDRRIYGNFIHARHHDEADNCHALLISVFSQFDDGAIELVPQSTWSEVIDCESEDRQPTVSANGE